jgi:2-desacetyl-2-hydroxyethyl bacteriochlorophyllide A dehydrogenase
MQTLICTQPHQFDYADTPIPILQEGYTNLQVKRIGICGTDLHAFEGTQPFFNYPRILGHELAAVVDATTDNNFEKGEAVTIIPYFNCGHCIACINNKPNCCVNMQVFGVHVDGGMREFIQVPNHALVKSQGLSFDELALVEPLAIGAHGVRRANVQPNEFVLVMGAGPIGLGIMEFVRISGAFVIAMDVNAQRLDFCKQHLQVQHTVNQMKEDVVEKIQHITNGNMPTVIIDATGNLKAINSAFLYMAHGGRYVLVGLQKEPLVVSHPEFHKRESTLMSSRNAITSDFDWVINCMKQKLINPATYITHRVQFAEVKEQFTSWLNPATGVIKAMVEM